MKKYPFKFPTFKKKLIKKITFVSLLLVGLLILSLTILFAFQTKRNFSQQLDHLSQENSRLETQLSETKQALTTLENQDQKVRNDQLEEKIQKIEQTYIESIDLYERMLDLNDKNVKTEKMAEELAVTIASLAKSDFDAAQKSMDTLDTLITEQEEKLKTQAALAIPTTSVVSSQPPGNGYARQTVETEVGSFVVSLVAADLSSTRVIVDTASGSDCTNDCPVLSLSDYVTRNGGYAGINGSYFCPASYPSCAGKTNTFDLLVMNKDKVYFNSDNNVYSTNPGVIFSNGSVRFVSAVSQWGRDTSIDGMLSNFPLLVSGNEIRFAGDGDPKKGSKGNRSFVANKGNTVYIGVVHGATVAESAWALKTLGMENALNLDSGGSTALWSGGYKVGPGRNIPNAIVFVRK